MRGKEKQRSLASKRWGLDLFEIDSCITVGCENVIEKCEMSGPRAHTTLNLPPKTRLI